MQPRDGSFTIKVNRGHNNKEKEIMTETAQGGAVAKTTTPATGSSTGSSSGSSYVSKPYYPRTETEFGLMWNDGQVTKATGVGSTATRDVIKWFTNSIKLRRIGVFTKNAYAVGIVSREVVKNGASSNDWEEGAWTKYELTREDMLELYKAG